MHQGTGEILAEFPSVLKAMEAVDFGAVLGLKPGEKYVVCEVHKVLSPKMDYFDITDEALNRTTDSNSAPKVNDPEEKPTQVTENHDVSDDFAPPENLTSTLEKEDKLGGSDSSEEEEYYPPLEDDYSGIDLEGN